MAKRGIGPETGWVVGCWGSILLSVVASCVDLAPRARHPDASDASDAPLADLADSPPEDVATDGASADVIQDAPARSEVSMSDASATGDAPDAPAAQDAPGALDIVDATLPNDRSDGAVSLDAADVATGADAADVSTDLAAPLDARADAADAGPVDAREEGSALPTPRWPQSGSLCTSRRPTLRWPLQALDDGARVDLCEDRACSRVITTVAGVDRAAPATDLPVGHVFWRVTPRRGGVDQAPLATWFFVVPRASAATPTAHGRVFDFNADGLADVCMGSELESLVSTGGGSARLFLRGAAGGLGATPAATFSQFANNSGTRVGSALTAGDFDGDGLIDLVVGARSEFTTAGAVGQVRVYRGTAGSPPANAVTTTLIQGTVSAEGLGQRVAVAGDVNLDGFDDLLVSSNLTVGTEGGMPSSGRVRLYLGSRAGLSSSPARQFVGAGTDQLGAGIDGDGDLNGDGYPDIAIGVPGASPGSRMNAGQVRVYLGAPSGVPTTATYTLDGPEAGERFGISVRVSGDLNGDGFTDLVVGATTATVGGVANAGRVYVYFGSPNFPGAPGGLSNPAVLNPAGAGSSFGSSLLTTVDVNGDGLRDLLAGAPGHSGAGERVGSVFIYLGHAAQGVEASPFARFNGVSCGDEFGNGLSNQGDLNRDGYGDFAVSATRAAQGRTTWVMCEGNNGPAHGAVYSFEGDGVEPRLRNGDTRFGPMGSWSAMRLVASARRLRRDCSRWLCPSLHPEQCGVAMPWSPRAPG